MKPWETGHKRCDTNGINRLIIPAKGDATRWRAQNEMPIIDAASPTTLRRKARKNEQFHRVICPKIQWNGTKSSALSTRHRPSVRRRCGRGRRTTYTARNSNRSVSVASTARASGGGWTLSLSLFLYLFLCLSVSRSCPLFFRRDRSSIADTIFQLHHWLRALSAASRGCVFTFFNIAEKQGVNWYSCANRSSLVLFKKKQGTGTFQRVVVCNDFMPRNDGDS